MQKYVSGGAAAALLAGMLVVAGVGVQSALAAPDAPAVTATPAQTLILGEDTSVDISITNESGDPTYNLSVTVMLPDTVDLIEPSPFGPFEKFVAGDELPGNPVASNGETCAKAGLEPVPSSTKCRVPAGKQYFVFTNFSDLPAGGTYSDSLTLRPRVDNSVDGSGPGFNVGDSVDVVVNAYTSENERYIPMFPGSTTKGAAAAEAATSGRGRADSESEVRALRITKSEPSPENELLRGVHDQTTVYTLTISHTGEGDLQNAKVVDFLPAGLEYLGSCSLTDNTTAANGLDGIDQEWANANDANDASGPLDTAGVTHCADESSIETIEMTQAIADRYPGRALQVGAVYTMVTWDLGEWLQTDSDVNGVAQVFPGTAGTAAQTIIQYRAGVPLFENELFPADSTPDPEGLTQGANLDNNTGASTRHGSADVAVDHNAKSYTNVAAASGDWKGTESSDSAEYTIDAVDTRVVKSVRVGRGNNWADRASFEQGHIADYRLSLATSEYVSAEQGDRPNRFTDDLDNGLCPVFPKDITRACLLYT